MHWAYYDRLKFLSSSLKIDDDDNDRDEENATPQHKSSDLSNGNIKPISAIGKKRKVDNIQSNLDNDQHHTHNIEVDPHPPPSLSHHNSQTVELDVDRSIPPRDPDEYGIGKYVGKTIQGLDEDLVDELVSQIVRDCLEVRHKQRLRHIEYYNRQNSLAN